MLSSRQVSLFGLALAVCFMVLLILALFTTRSLLENEHLAYERVRLQTALDNEARLLRKNTLDHSWWDETYAAVNNGINTAWLSDTLSANTLHLLNAEGVAVFNPDAEPLFSRLLSPELASQPIQRIQQWLRQQRFSCPHPDENPPDWQHARINWLIDGEYALLASAAVISPTAQQLDCKRVYTLVFWQVLGPSQLNELAQNYAFNSLRFQAATATIELPDNALALGEAGLLFWQSTPPTSAPINKALLLAAILTLAVVLLGWILQRQLRNNDRYFLELFERNRSIQLLVRPQDGRIRLANRAADAFYGFPSGELERLSLFDLNGDPHSDPLALLQGQNPSQCYQRLWNGSVRLVEIHSGQLVRAGEPLLYLIVHDITQTLEAREALSRSEARYRTIIEDASLGILQLDEQGNILEANPAFSQMLGYHPRALHGWLWTDLVHPDEQEATLRTFNALQERITPKLSHQQRFQHSQGQIIWAQVSISPIEIGDSELSFVAMVENINERIQLQQQLQELAHRDPLTGLHNRRALEDFAKREQAWGKRHGQPICIMIADLDHFKKVNDTYGHGVGDIVLQHFADICRDTMRDTDIVGRWGGEEFVMLLPHTDLKKALMVADRLRQAVGRHVTQTDEHQLKVTVSIGLSQWHTAQEELVTALERADAALYNAKRNGRNRVECDYHAPKGNHLPHIDL
ncbi:diguanylate cyclase [Balneatrix alpica]|uniref:diguanylate cyclase n=1 Tax=Balneatrix alpica TaxID=75684 RepID=UPI002738CC38|nr:diguanylate cyclase [Balneatrix alpica]